jgi:hypothetical protein
LASIRIRPRVIISAEQWLGQEIEGAKVIEVEDYGLFLILDGEEPTINYMAGNGDWVITGYTGNRFVCPADKFHERYEVQV